MCEGATPCAESRSSGRVQKGDYMLIVAFDRHSAADLGRGREAGEYQMRCADR